MDHTSPALPSAADVQDAALRLQGQAVVTPLLRCPWLDQQTGARILIKPEMLQVTGSFKFRGAYNRMSRIIPERRRYGVVAWSSGNHAQGVAEAARRLGMTATIVMPHDAPQVKIDGTRRLGARIVLYDRYREDREAIGHRLAEEQGATLVPAFEDFYVVAGQGTIGLEIGQQAQAMGLSVDMALVNCGGGGLIGGTAVGLHSIFPDAQIWATEPQGFDDMARSLVSGQLETNDPAARSICDAILTPKPGHIAFALARRHLAGGVSVTDAQAMSAMRVVFQHLKLVVEPGAVVSLAAVLAGRIDVKGKTVAVVLSGGNVDPQLFAHALATENVDAA